MANECYSGRPCPSAIRHDQAVRVVRRGDLQARFVPIANWSRIVP